MIIPVFGDIHGNIEGLFTTLQHLQRKWGGKFSHVLQVGDLGYFPNEKNLDKETKRRWNRETEQGMHQYLSSPKLFEKFFVSAKDLDKLECKIIFVRGNHEDNDVLKQKEKEVKEGLVALDVNKKLLYLPDGRAVSIKKDSESDILIGGYGGVYPRSQKSDDMARICEKSLDSILSYQHIDVLMTHQGTEPAKRGHEFFSALCELIKPKIHLHGHGHDQNGPYEVGQTKSYSLGKMPHEKRPYLYDNKFYGFLALEKKLTFIEARQLEREH